MFRLFDMERIKLPRGEWQYDGAKPLGHRGGFGTVYLGFSEALGNLAVKRLHLSASHAAHREIEIATDLAGRELKNVISVLDAGEDPDSGGYFVVMPKADKSLQDDLGRGVRFTDLDAARVLLHIADALIEVGDIVHRDLKPANVLFHDGRWKVADFGIARFVEESTSLQTLKGCLTPEYAAPEQWQYVRATSATDVYALGCIGVAVLTGRAPFSGRAEDELREQHLHADPPVLPQVTPRLRAIITMMLRKPMEARPSIHRVRNVLNAIIENPPNPVPDRFGLLAEAGANVARLQAEKERRDQQALAQSKTRSQLAQSGRKILAEIGSRLLSWIETEAPIAKRLDSLTVMGVEGFGINLGTATLHVSFKRHLRRPDDYDCLPVNAFNQSQWDVLVGERIQVEQYNPKYEWSASLWYCRIPNTVEYRWYEVSYFAPSLAEAFAPYALTTRVNDADLAAAPIMHVYQLAFGPSAIDDEDEKDFLDRWATLLSLASLGRLGHPQALPLQERFWRLPLFA
jgi:serine/threonine-protein kinase